MRARALWDQVRNQIPPARTACARRAECRGMRREAAEPLQNCLFLRVLSHLLGVASSFDVLCLCPERFKQILVRMFKSCAQFESTRVRCCPILSVYLRSVGSTSSSTVSRTREATSALLAARRDRMLSLWPIRGRAGPFSAARGILTWTPGFVLNTPLRASAPLDSVWLWTVVGRTVVPVGNPATRAAAESYFLRLRLRCRVGSFRRCRAFLAS
jgi:hypothetical protein